MVLCLAALVQSLPAQAIRLSEYQIKASFLFNFTKFVEWPQDAFSTDEKVLTIGILGNDAFGNAFKSIVEQKVMGRRVQVQHLNRDEKVDNCQVLFISDSEKEHLPQILQRVNGTRILTVGETEDFTRQGGMINLVRQKNKMHIEVNVAAAERAGLKLSSRLLKLATIVEEGRGRKGP